MSDVLLQIGGTKLVLSAVLACAAWMVHRRVRLPGVSYPMWLLVLVVLLVPAFMSVPVLPAAAGVQTGLELAPTGSAEGAGGPGFYGTPLGSWLAATGTRGLAVLWLLGTTALLGWTLLRAVRFRRTLAQALEPAGPELQRQAARIGRRLGLARVPEIHTTHARISPMVWWTGGRVRVLIPTYLLAELTAEEARSILAHELAHVRRRDYIVRWLEWVACSVFWWNPAAWWASRQLRAAEEACCDALVPGAAGSSPKSYASALLRVVDIASETPMLRAPVLASAAGGVGNTKALEGRLMMIVETRTSTTPRWLRTAAWALAICALPLGIVYCDRPETPVAPDQEMLDAPAAADANDAAQSGDTDDAAVAAALDDRRTARLNALRRDLRVRIAAGEITREEAREQLEGIQVRMEAVRSEAEAAADRSDAGEADADPADDDRRIRYRQTAVELRALVEAGGITAEQAEQRLVRLRMQLWRNPGGSGDGNR